MKKMLVLGVGLLLLSACGGGGSSSKQKATPTNPMSRVAEGEIPFQRYVITNRPDKSLPWCSISKGFLIIKNSVVSGTIISASKSFLVFGTYIPETGNISGGFPKNHPILNFTGVIDLEKGEGTWSDDFGCRGIWEAIKEKK